MFSKNNWLDEPEASVPSEQTELEQCKQKKMYLVEPGTQPTEILVPTLAISESNIYKQYVKDVKLINFHLAPQ